MVIARHTRPLTRCVQNPARLSPRHARGKKLSAATLDQERSRCERWPNALLLPATCGRTC